MTDKKKRFVSFQWRVGLTCKSCKAPWSLSLERIPPPVMAVECPGCGEHLRAAFTPALLDALITDMMDQMLKAHFEVEEGERE